MVKVWGNTFNKPSNGYKKQYERYNIKNMQTYLNPSLSDRKEYKFKKIKSRNKGILEVFPIPDNFRERNKRFVSEYRDDVKPHHPTLGLYGVDMASAYKPNTIHIIGLDFYQAPDFVEEKKHIQLSKNAARGKGMMNYLKALCRVEPDIKFYLYTCCDQIKSHKNLKVIKV